MKKAHVSQGRLGSVNWPVGTGFAGPPEFHRLQGRTQSEISVIGNVGYPTLRFHPTWRAGKWTIYQ